MKNPIKKHVNLLILIFLILDIALIYFSFFGFTERNKSVELSSKNNLITNINVEYEALGNPFAHVKITDTSDTSAEINQVVAKVGNSFDISGNFGNFQLQEATVTLSYDKNKLPENIPEEDLCIFWYDEENKQTVQMPSTIDTTNQTITFQTDHFSQYTLGSNKMWEEIWDKEMAKLREANVNFSLQFIIDDSGSMSSNDPNNRRLSATTSAINALSEEDRYMIIKFNSSSEVVQDFTFDKNLATTALGNFQSNGGTNIVGAVEKGIELFNQSPLTSKKIIILLTDGEDYNLAAQKDDLISKAKQSNIIIFGIGLEDSSNLNFDALSSLATGTTGRFHRINESELSNIFLEITNAVVGVDGTLDTDNDGIPNGIEIAGMRDQYGNIVYTNAYLADTDGDGISDKEEIGKLKHNEFGKPYYEKVSNPLLNEKDPVEYLNAYHLGPTENAIEVHDSGFRQNVNGFSFPNFKFKNHGNCAGFAYLTEKVFNGYLDITEDANGTKYYGRYLIADTFQTLITSKRLYDYKLTYEELKLKQGPDDTIHTNIVDDNLNNYPNDSRLVHEIENQYQLSNQGDYMTFLEAILYPYIKVLEFNQHFRSAYVITDLAILKLSHIFDNSQIVTVSLCRDTIVKEQDKFLPNYEYLGHCVNAYAIEKMDNSGNEYRLYVYDNNFPYNPYYIRDKQNGNTYITLKKNYKGTYDFEYAPYGKEVNSYLWSYNTPCTCITFSLKTKPIIWF